eukprot:NODE_18_length_47517_cov_0.674814.p1 type:complete len:2317 gc:universal NODE_18_length_47517_cov_0.674814:16848-9898(-)
MEQSELFTDVLRKLLRKEKIEIEPIPDTFGDSVEYLKSFEEPLIWNQVMKVRTALDKKELKMRKVDFEEYDSIRLKCKFQMNKSELFYFQDLAIFKSKKSNIYSLDKVIENVENGSVVFGFVEGLETEGNEQEVIFRFLDPLNSFSEWKDFIDDMEPVAHVVDNFIPFNRIYKSLQDVDRVRKSPLRNHVLHGFMDPFKVDRNLESALKADTSFSQLNESQKEAIKAVISGGFQDSNISLIQGPPGTGKTLLISTIIHQLLRFHEMSCIMVCAPTNTAVVNVLDKFIKVYGHENGILLVGRSEKLIDENLLPEDLKRYYALEIIEQFNYKLDSILKVIEEKVSTIQANFRKSKIESYCTELLHLLNSKLEELEVFDDEIPYNYLKMRDISTDCQHILKKYFSHFTNIFKSIEEGKDCVVKDFELLLNQVGPSYFTCLPQHSEKYQMEKQMIKNARLVFTTVNGSMSSKFCTEGKERKKFDFTIVDEACQLIEAEATCLINNCRRLTMVGDPAQLRATTFLESTMEINYDRSLFERLFNRGFQRYILDKQYRMPKLVGDLVSTHFYEGALKSHDDGQKFPLWKDGFFEALTFVKVDHGKERKSEDGSWYNEEEVAIVKELLFRYKKYQKETSIGIITPYDSQRSELRKCVSKMNMSVSIDTVDSFQGREADLIIFTCVRANAHGNIGFLKNENRMNVALSRCKQSLVVVGNLKCLKKSDSKWSEILSEHFVIKDSLSLISKKVQNLQMVKSDFSLQDAVQMKNLHFLRFGQIVLTYFNRAKQDEKKRIFMLLDKICDAHSKVNFLNLITDPKYSYDIIHFQEKKTKMRVVILRQKNNILKVELISMSETASLKTVEKLKALLDGKSNESDESIFNEKVFSFSHSIVNYLLKNDDVTLKIPYEFSDEEKEVLLGNNSFYLVARAGTGKTSCLLARLLDMAKYGIYESVNTKFLFVTAAKSLRDSIASKFLEWFESFLTLERPDLLAAVGNNLSELKRLDHFNIQFKTFDELYRYVLRDQLSELKVLDYHLFFQYYKEKFHCDLDPLGFFTELNLIVGANLTEEEYLKRQRKLYLESLLRDLFKEAQKMHRNIIHDGYTLRAEVQIMCLDRVMKEPFENYSAVFIDEVQDVSSEEIKMLTYLSDPENVYFGGDPAQQIYEGSSFKMERVKDILFQRLKYLHPDTTENDLGHRMPISYQLTTNFRYNDKILNFGAKLIEIMESLFPQDIKKLAKETSTKFSVKLPLFIESNDIMVLKKYLYGEVASLGANQCVVVYNQKDKEKFENIDENATVLTIKEIKGMEFEDVVLFNIFSHGISPRTAENIETNLQGLSHYEFSNTVALDLKLKYTAISRSQNRLIMFDEKIEAGNILKSLFGSTFDRVVDGAGNFAVHSTMEEFLEKGIELRNRDNFAAALRCFRRAGSEIEQNRTKAIQCWRNGDYQNAVSFFQSVLDANIKNMLLDDISNQLQVFLDAFGKPNYEKDDKINCNCYYNRLEPFVHLSIKNSSQIESPEKFLRCFISNSEYNLYSKAFQLLKPISDSYSAAIKQLSKFVREIFARDDRVTKSELQQLLVLLYSNDQEILFKTFLEFKRIRMAAEFSIKMDLKEKGINFLLESHDYGHLLHIYKKYDIECPLSHVNIALCTYGISDSLLKDLKIIGRNENEEFFHNYLQKLPLSKDNLDKLDPYFKLLYVSKQRNKLEFKKFIDLLNDIVAWLFKLRLLKAYSNKAEYRKFNYLLLELGIVKQEDRFVKIGSKAEQSSCVYPEHKNDTVKYSIQIFNGLPSMMRRHVQTFENSVDCIFKFDPDFGPILNQFNLELPIGVDWKVMYDYENLFRWIESLSLFCLNLYGRFQKIVPNVFQNSSMLSLLRVFVVFPEYWIHAGEHPFYKYKQAMHFYIKQLTSRNDITNNSNYYCAVSLFATLNDISMKDVSNAEYLIAYNEVLMSLKLHQTMESQMKLGPFLLKTVNLAKRNQICVSPWIFLTLLELFVSHSVIMAARHPMFEYLLIPFSYYSNYCAKDHSVHSFNMGPLQRFMTELFGFMGVLTTQFLDRWSVLASSSSQSLGHYRFIFYTRFYKACFVLLQLIRKHNQLMDLKKHIIRDTNLFSEVLLNENTSHPTAIGHFMWETIQYEMHDPVIYLFKKASDDPNVVTINLNESTHILSCPILNKKPEPVENFMKYIQASKHGTLETIVFECNSHLLSKFERAIKKWLSISKSKSNAYKILRGNALAQSLHKLDCNLKSMYFEKCVNLCFRNLFLYQFLECRSLISSAFSSLIFEENVEPLLSFFENQDKFTNYFDLQQNVKQVKTIASFKSFQGC